MKKKVFGFVAAATMSIYSFCLYANVNASEKAWGCVWNGIWNQYCVYGGLHITECVNTTSTGDCLYN